MLGQLIREIIHNDPVLRLIDEMVVTNMHQVDIKFAVFKIALDRALNILYK